jgi:transcriptional adapter 3
MPRANFPNTLLTLIQSTSYPPLPPRDDLDSLRQVLSEQRSLPVTVKRKREESIPIIEKRRTSPPVKLERSVSPVGSVISIAGPSSLPKASTPNAPITYAGIKNKKKKKPFESDDDGESSPSGEERVLMIVRSISSPPTHHTTSTSGLKLKLNKSLPRPIENYPIAPSAYGVHIDFSLPPPPSRPLVPPRPGVSKPPQPGPKRQSEVDEDFSNTKAPTQTAQPTFWTSVEPYLREIREDDLAMLNFKADAPESYDIPARGRHYTEMWDEEDGLPLGTTPRYPVPSMRHGHGPQGLGHFTPATEMREEHLVDEHRGLGNLTERIVAGIVENTNVQVTDGGDLYEGNRELARVDVVELEEKIKRELRGAMLLGDQEDYIPQNRDDDEITSSLRQCQRLLLEQSQINEARKSRLAEIAQHRLAYAEYSQSLDGIEKSIETAWVKRVKKHGASAKKGRQSSEGTPGPSGSGRPPVPENVKKLVAVRRGWVDSVGKTMSVRPKGEVMGIPDESIYEGLGEEVDERVVDEAVELGEESP